MKKDVNPVTTLSNYPVAGYAVTISSNNKWLYYVVKGKDGLVLQREKVRE